MECREYDGGTEEAVLGHVQETVSYGHLEKLRSTFVVTGSFVKIADARQVFCTSLSTFPALYYVMIYLLLLTIRSCTLFFATYET